MVYIEIDDGFNTKYDGYDEELEWEVCGLYDVLNVREIRMRIANAFLDEEEITEKKIKKEINKYLLPLKNEILEETIEVLEQNNGREVKQNTEKSRYEAFIKDLMKEYDISENEAEIYYRDIYENIEQDGLYYDFEAIRLIEDEIW